MATYNPETKDKNISFRLSETEYKDIKKYCNKNGYKLGSYVRFIVIESMKTI